MSLMTKDAVFLFINETEMTVWLSFIDILKGIIILTIQIIYLNWLRITWKVQKGLFCAEMW